MPLHCLQGRDTRVMTQRHDRDGGRRETERESEDGGENKDEVKANLERKMEGEATARGEPVRLRAAVDGARCEGNKRSM